MTIREAQFMPNGSDWWFPPPAGFSHSCGSLGSAEDQHVSLVYSDSSCLRCGHAPCPCCGNYCDDAVLDDDNDYYGPCSCFEHSSCLYEGGKTPQFVHLDLQWMRSLLLYLKSNYYWGQCSLEKALADLGPFDRYLRLGIIVESSRLFARGDAVLVMWSNGAGSRQPVYGYSSKGRSVAHYYMKYATNFYPNVGGAVCYDRVESCLRGPLWMPELPGEVANLSPLDPGVSEYIRQLRAQLAARGSGLRAASRPASSG